MVHLIFFTSSFRRAQERLPFIIDCGRYPIVSAPCQLSRSESQQDNDASIALARCCSQSSRSRGAITQPHQATKTRLSVLPASQRDCYSRDPAVPTRSGDHINVCKARLIKITKWRIYWVSTNVSAGKRRPLIAEICVISMPSIRCDSMLMLCERMFMEKHMFATIQSNRGFFHSRTRRVHIFATCLQQGAGPRRFGSKSVALHLEEHVKNN